MSPCRWNLQPLPNQSRLGLQAAFSLFKHPSQAISHSSPTASTLSFMPLPSAPTKRAALLAPEAYDAPARTSARASRKPQADEEGITVDGNARTAAPVERASD